MYEKTCDLYNKALDKLVKRKKEIKELNDEYIEHRKKAEKFEDAYTKKVSELNAVEKNYHILDEKRKSLEFQLKESEKMFIMTSDNLKLEKELSDSVETERDVLEGKVEVFERMISLIELLNTKDE